MVPEDYLIKLGKEIRLLRKQQGINSQEDLRKRANVALNVVRNIESGKNTETLSLIRVLRVLDSLKWIEHLVSEPSVSPVELLKKVRQGKT